MCLAFSGRVFVWRGIDERTGAGLFGEMARDVIASRSTEKRQRAEQYREEGRVFLAKNAQRKNVKTLPSGLQYRVIREGRGKSPKLTDTVTVHYRGTLIGGREFDSSYRDGEPAQYRVDSVMPGWTEALQRMRVGSLWQLFIPPDMAYRRRGPLANRTLIYELELLAVNREVDQSAAAGGRDGDH